MVQLLIACPRRMKHWTKHFFVKATQIMLPPQNEPMKSNHRCFKTMLRMKITAYIQKFLWSNAVKKYSTKWATSLAVTLCYSSYSWSRDFLSYRKNRCTTLGGFFYQLFLSLVSYFQRTVCMQLLLYGIMWLPNSF